MSGLLFPTGHIILHSECNDAPAVSATVTTGVAAGAGWRSLIMIATVIVMVAVPSTRNSHTA